MFEISSRSPDPKKEMESVCQLVGNSAKTIAAVFRSFEEVLNKFIVNLSQQI